MGRSTRTGTFRPALGAAILLSVLGFLGASNAVLAHAATPVAAQAR